MPASAPSIKQGVRKERKLHFGAGVAADQQNKRRIHMKKAAHRRRHSSEGPLIDVARTIGSTLGTVVATVSRARRLASGKTVKRATRKAAVVRKRIRKAIKRR